MINFTNSDIDLYFNNPIQDDKIEYLLYQLLQYRFDGQLNKLSVKYDGTNVVCKFNGDEKSKKRVNDYLKSLLSIQSVSTQ